MDQEFRRLVLQLVEKHGGNQRAAMAASGLGPTVINRAVQGLGPKFPRPDSWAKLYKALGRPPAAVHEERGEYRDKFDDLCEWVRKHVHDHPDHFAAFVALAKGFGYDDGAAPPGASSGHERGVRSNGADSGAGQHRGIHQSVGR